MIRVVYPVRCGSNELSKQTKKWLISNQSSQNYVRQFKMSLPQVTAAILETPYIQGTSKESDSSGSPILIGALFVGREMQGMSTVKAYIAYLHNCEKEFQFLQLLRGSAHQVYTSY